MKRPLTLADCRPGDRVECLGSTYSGTVTEVFPGTVYLKTSHQVETPFGVLNRHQTLGLAPSAKVRRLK